jgi:HSP20 family molecular chaperone IbpA
MNALVTRRLFGPRSSWALRDFGDLTREIDSLFNGAFGSRPNGSDADWTPHVESYVKDDTLRVRADLPGIDPKAVDVSVEKDVLTISGLLRILQTFDSEADAVRSFASKAHSKA